MEPVFVKKLKTLLDAIAADVELYVPNKSNGHYVFSRYDKDSDAEPEFNSIRACTPVKEFMFPIRELAAVFPKELEPEEIEPFAVFGLKNCDLRSIEILDKVFKEEDFLDPFYIARREKMFIISADCTEPGKSCFCNIMNGRSYPESDFDLNVSKVKDGFIINAGSQKGIDFLEKNSGLFSRVNSEAIAERDRNRENTEKRLEEINAQFKLSCPVNEVVENSDDSELYDVEASGCVECQACTRVCPTCHCFYLQDTKLKDYYAKMKMWDGCMRLSYATVAGGENPRRILGDRLKHRLMHKFSYFLERYGLDMCVGCGRCIDAEVGNLRDLRALFKKLEEEMKNRKAKAGK
ncbi:MAG: 4Fe-4S dicluster domain-containing protein [Planctomycetota bacterium]|jgi:ferredoxin